MNSLSVSLQTVLLLAASNVFMTFAWYGHLKNLDAQAVVVAALVSWGIALFEYLLQVPANRIGFAGGLSLAQLKIMQEVITLAVFVPFALLYMGQPFKLDFLWAGLCLVGAVYFVFRGMTIDGRPRSAFATSSSRGRSASARARWRSGSAAHLGAELLLERPEENPFLARYYDDGRAMRSRPSSSSCSSAWGSCGELAQPGMFERGTVVGDSCSEGRAVRAR